VCGPRFTKFISSNMEEDVVDRVFFLIFDICRSFPKIFAIKVESCQKSCRNLDVFALPKFMGQAFQKLYGTNISPVPCGTPLEKFHEDTPTNLIITALSRESYFVHMFTILMNGFGCGCFGFGCFGLWHFIFSVWPFWSDLWPFWLWPFWFVAVLDVIRLLPCCH